MRRGSQIRIFTKKKRATIVGAWVTPHGSARNQIKERKTELMARMKNQCLNEKIVSFIAIESLDD